jgi:uncharacterized sporulation protein YeaH/YhbH (DUF444 family)
MTDKLPTATYIFIDRRKTGRGKSLPNRQRLLRRIKDAIRDSKPKDIDAGGVKGSATGNSTAGPVSVTRDCLHEPTFHYDHNSGTHEVVLIGNDEWERGDEFPIDGGEGSGSGSGNGAGHGQDDSEDDFVVNVSREEFFNVFFEDCELPDLQETNAKELPETMPKHAGFQKEGNPAQLSVIRSYKNALPRRRALSHEARSELEELEAEYQKLAAELVDGTSPSEPVHARMSEIELRIAELRAKISNVPFFEKLDLRYTKKEKVLVKSADAVFCMIMDISGSMDEDKKRIARKFFSLQYAFIKKKYPNTDLVFVAHTEKAMEMSEEEFFTSRVSGGTTVSPAYTLLHDIIKARYDSTQTNIYLSQASDGDNWGHDNSNIIPELETSGLLSKLRHMSYAHVGPESWSQELWTVLSSIASSSSMQKLSMVKIYDDSDVFDAFRSIYAKNKA